MTEDAAVVVIGGGVIGASVAYHLALGGMRNVVVVDRSASPGEGSTGRATGGFRAQFESPVNVQLSLDSRARLLKFKEDTGVDPGYTPVGYLWLACNDRHMELLRCARLVQHEHGLTEARELTITEAAAANPHVAMDDVMGAAFCPTDGYIDTLAILKGYREAGERRGVSYRWNTEVTSIDASGGQGVHLGTSDGELNADIVVNAAGPWAGVIAAMAGVDLPITPVRRQAAVTQPAPHISPSMPMTIYMDTGFHLRARDGRAVLCWPTDAPNPEDPAPVADDYWVEAVRVMIDQRVPALRAVGVDRKLCYSGLYEMSPDKHAIVGFAPECPKMFLVNGSSGHGIMHSPALGAAAADMIGGRAPALDLSVLNPGRFASGTFLEAGLL